jgi:hypothetical protein
MCRQSQNQNNIHQVSRYSATDLFSLIVRKPIVLFSPELLRFSGLLIAQAAHIEDVSKRNQGIPCDCDRLPISSQVSVGEMPGLKQTAERPVLEKESGFSFSWALSYRGCFIQSSQVKSSQVLHLKFRNAEHVEPHGNLYP